tara:strand:- start:1217 stop:2158 length:942 start_codon:yes stop_codon:yes gene_type:complete
MITQQTKTEKQKPFYITSDLIEEWAEITLRDKESSYLTGIDDFDELLEGSLRGKFLALIGKGGSGKSIFGLQVATGNSINTNTVGAFLNGEMSNANLFSRILDYGFGATDKTNNKRASLHFKDTLTKSNKEAMVAKLRDKMNMMFKDSLIVTNETNVESLYKLVATVRNSGKEVLGIVVDSAAMMDSKNGMGNTELAEYYSKEYKKLANKENICVLTIYHVPKSVPNDKRDLSEDGKDAGKIFDNADVTISFSSILDEEGKRIKELKYLQLFDKRGSGEYRDVICEVDQNHLVLRKTGYDPYDERFKERSLRD